MPKSFFFVCMLAGLILFAGRASADVPSAPITETRQAVRADMPVREAERVLIGANYIEDDIGLIHRWGKDDTTYFLAFSRIMQQDEESAKASLNRIFQQAQHVAGKLYALAGLCQLDFSTYNKLRQTISSGTKVDVQRIPFKDFPAYGYDKRIEANAKQWADRFASYLQTDKYDVDTALRALARVNQVEDCAVGMGPQPSFLSALYRFVAADPDARQHFRTLLRQSQTTEAKLYALAGLHQTDPENYFALKANVDLESSVMFLSGDIGGYVPTVDILKQIEHPEINTGYPELNTQQWPNCPR